jgi:hypothetical protein
MSRQDVEEKFLSLAAPVVDEETAHEVVEEVRLLDTCESLAPLLDLLVVR